MQWWEASLTSKFDVQGQIWTLGVKMPIFAIIEHFDGIFCHYGNLPFADCSDDDFSI